MIKKESSVIFAASIVLVVFLMANVSAGIYFSQLQPVYNLGDMIEMDIQVSPEDVGPIKINLNCDGNSSEVYRGGVPEKIQLPLNSLWMSGMTGECYFIGEYNGELKESTGFKISKKINIIISQSSFFAKPEENIEISGTANRLSGNEVNGEIELKIPNLFGENENKFYGKVIDGAFSMNLTVPRNSASRDYRIDINVYEKSENEKISEGIATANLRVFQMPSFVDIALDSLNIDPGKSINFKLILMDQTEKIMDGDVSVIITNKNSVRVFERFVKSGETVEYKTPENMTAGYYNIEASSGELSRTKSFFINEKAIVSFEIRNNTLIIRNIGNIPYNKDIQIELGGKTFIQKLKNFAPGESKEFRLSGNGEYDVKITDGETEISQKVPLTGAAVGVDGVKKGVSALVNTPIIWIIAIIILGTIILFLFRDSLKKKSFAYPKPEKRILNIEAKSESPSKIIKFDEKGMEIKQAGIKEPEKVKSPSYLSVGDKKLSPMPESKPKPYWIKHEEENQAPVIASEEFHKKENVKQTPIAPVVIMRGKIKENFPNQAEQVLVMDGNRNRAVVIALKIKNQINKLSKENLERAIEHVYEKKGAVSEHGNYIFVVFSPLITKSFKNETEAIRAAQKIAEGLKEHNSRFSDKIQFGIGINSGDVINKIEDKKLKFTSLGSLTIAAKKLADISNGEILITKNAYEKSLTEVKADKKIANGMEFYELKKIADYEKNKKFIQDFLKRERDERSNMINRHSVMPRPSPSPASPSQNPNQNNNFSQNNKFI